MISLSGCTGDRCIDADDFGFIKFVISSRYKKPTKHEYGYASDEQEGNISAPQPDNQSAPWVNSGYNVNGQPLTILVKTWDYGKGDKNSSSELSAWGPWFGKEEHSCTLSEFSKRLQECRFIDNRMCTDTKDAKIINAPCLFKNGKGLYYLIAKRGENPNLSEDSQRSPKGITGHLGEPNTGHTLYDLTKRGEHIEAGGVNYQYDGDKNKSTNYSQCSLYFKILDKFYDDNNGQYRVVIKSGVSDTRPDPLEFLTNLIKEELFGNKKHPGLVRSVYENIIKTPGYRITVSALLTLYIMFMAANFLIGNVNFTHTELIVRLLKVSIVSTMLSSVSSWQFFHDYLFVFFIEGVEQILQIIKETGNTGPGSSSLIGLMIAPQTMAKLFSLLFTDALGFIYIFLFLIALCFIFMMVFKATIIYLTALITIGMIIIMAPIFICFMLFGITRSLFENWLRQLISYAIQPIILFTGIAFISMIVRSEIYSSLGFAVCKYDFPDLGPINTLFGNINDDLDSSLGDSILYWWFPSPMKSNKFTKKKANILIPVDHRVDDGSEFGKLCLAYECTGERYIEFPFLDPVKDTKRLTDFFNGKFVQLDGLLLIFVCVYLLKKFNEVAVSSARFLSSTSGNLTSIQRVGDNAYNSIKKYTADQTQKYAIDPAKDYVKRRASRADSWISKEGLNHPTLLKLYEMAKNPSMAAAEYYQERIIGRLQKEALTKSANPSVLDEVRRKYGIDRTDVDPEAVANYRQALEDRLKNLDPTRKLNLDDLAQQDYSTLKDGLAGVMKSKKYSALNKTEKEEIDNILKDTSKGSSLRELASDAKYTRDFQKAYANSHQEMSARGVGLFGKKIAPLRMWQEIDNRVKSKKEINKAKRLNRGERIYAGYEGIKRAAITGVIGEDLRNAFEGNLTGAAWHDFDYNDRRLRTYHEALKDTNRELEYKKLNNKINKETIAEGADILSPEYLARVQIQGGAGNNDYEKMSYEKLKYDIDSQLSAGEEPVLMGDRFMREKASDSQTRKMIEDAYKVGNKLIQEDRYIGRKERYEIAKERAEARVKENLDFLSKEYPDSKIEKEEMPALLAQYYNNAIQDVNTLSASIDMSTKMEELHIRDQRNIDDNLQILSRHYGRNNIRKEEMPELLKQYYGSKSPAGKFPDDIGKEVSDLQLSIYNVDYSKAVLNKIEEREKFIKNRIEKTVENINKYRVDAKSNMTKYNLKEEDKWDS
ncbi:MAG: type IV secretion system protein [Candidatus Rickettsia vulgarisii]